MHRKKNKFKQTGKNKKYELTSSLTHAHVGILKIIFLRAIKFVKSIGQTNVQTSE